VSPAVRFVLVRPRNPLNIGAAARALANFGFDDMAVVKPYAPVWRETTSAVGAEKLVLAARAMNRLEEAVADADLVLGTTAVRDRHLDRSLVRLPDLGTFLKDRRPGRVAVLFGNEKTGLPASALERCHAWLTVPTAPAQPSLNLSHAVSLVAYELSRLRGDLGPAPRENPPADAAALERLTQQVLELFKAAGYLPSLPPRMKAEKIRRALYNWRVGAADVRLLHGIIRYIGHRLAEK
jgi:tRNA/rRNA methyltransferase